jgi:hypothetical protein
MPVYQNDVRSRLVVGVNGERVYVDPLDILDTVINSTPQAKQTHEVTVATATNDHEYVVTINGIDVEYTADAATSKIEIADGLAEAINADPLVRGQVVATSDGVDKVTLESTYPGLAFTYSDADSKLTDAAGTSNDEADPIPFGYLVMQSSYSDDGEKIGGVVKSAALVAQVDTLTVDYVAGELYGVQINIDGESYGVEVAANTDDATTVADIVTAINLKMPANTVIAAAASGTTITLTAEVAGKAFVVSTWQKIGTAASLSVAHTVDSDLTDLTKCAAGVALRGFDEEENSDSDTEYPANAGARVLRRGSVYVTTAETPAKGAAVYVETDGATAGKLYASSSATRIRLPKSIASWQSYNADDGLGVVRVNFGQV